MTKESTPTEQCIYCNKTKDNHYHDVILKRYACVSPGGYIAALLTYTPKI